MKHELMEITQADEPDTILAYYDPDYKHRCTVCGAKPCVRIRYENGKIFYYAGMCGACTWGEADALDPRNW